MDGDKKILTGHTNIKTILDYTLELDTPFSPPHEEPNQEIDQLATLSSLFMRIKSQFSRDYLLNIAAQLAR